jgi:hypothetical protein
MQVALCGFRILCSLSTGLQPMSITCGRGAKYLGLANTVYIRVIITVALHYHTQYIRVIYTVLANPYFKYFIIFRGTKKS